MSERAVVDYSDGVGSVVLHLFTKAAPNSDVAQSQYAGAAPLNALIDTSAEPGTKSLTCCDELIADESWNESKWAGETMTAKGKWRGDRRPKLSRSSAKTGRLTDLGAY